LKTYEIKLVAGERGEGEVFTVSTNREDLAKVLRQQIGKRVNVKYNGWVIAPYSEGESNNILSTVKTFP